MCEPAWKATVLGSTFTIAMCLTLLWWPRLADKFGRKLIFTVTRILDCIFFTILMASENYFLTLVSLIGLGAMTPGRLNVGIVYLNEWFPRRR